MEKERIFLIVGLLAISFVLLIFVGNMTGSAMLNWGDNSVYQKGMVVSPALQAQIDDMEQRMTLVEQENMMGGRDFGNCELIENPEVFKIISLDAGPYLGDGNDLCKDLGYQRCFALNMESEIRYYNSINGNCDGKVEDWVRMEVMKSCSTSIVPNPQWTCESLSASDSYSEPYLGDRHENMNFMSAICCKR